MVSVNLTTTRARWPLCRIALTSLLMQSHPADQINLWISKTPFLADSGFTEDTRLAIFLAELPAAWRERLEVHWVENTGPYRKLLPALRSAGPNDLVVTADDDIFYGRDWLRLLLEADADCAGSGRVVASRVRLQRKNPLGGLTSYLHWPLATEAVTLQAGYVVTFGGGAVLTRDAFTEQDLASDAFLELAPTADDLWYSRLLQRRGLAVQVVPAALQELHFIEHSRGLKQHNLPLRHSTWQRLVWRLRDRPLGYWGLPVCGNDQAFRRLESYFSQQEQQP